MNYKSIIAQSRLQKTKKSTKNCSTRDKLTGLIPTSIKQLSLFTDLVDSENESDSELPAYPLQISYIPHEQRLTPDKFCKLIHHSSGLTIEGQFSYEQAKEILVVSRDWDWRLDKDKIPRCSAKLRSLLKSSVAEGGER